MKSIPSEYIKTFIPIQELDELNASSGQTAKIQPNDLFLISQISAYSSRSSNAIAVSKKINYKNFSEKLSDDFSIGGIKLSVAGKIQPIYDLSSQLNETSSFLSNSIQISSNVLCAAICNVNVDLSNAISTIQNDYIKKYGNQTCSLIDQTNDYSNPASFAVSVELSNGFITGIEKRPLSSLISPKDWRISYGGIAANDKLTSYVLNVSDDTTKSIEQQILSDCYVNCSISAREDDSYGPLQIYISSTINDTGDTASALYATLNNPGGFSGKDYFNNYHITIPLKALYGSKIIIKYADESLNFKNGTKAVIDCYYYYSVPSKDDLNAYAKKSSIPGSDLSDHVYALQFAEGGIITHATSVYYGISQHDVAGLVRTGQQFDIPNYGIMLSDEYAYVNIPYATSSTYGTTKYKYSDDENNHHHYFGNEEYQNGSKHFLKCGLEHDESGNSLTYVPCASNDTFGTIKLKQNAISAAANSDNPLSSYLGVDSNGCGYVNIPYAHYDQNGQPIPGIVKTGYPDTTSIRVVRNVYLNKNGVACVNVANQIGIGPFVENDVSGFTKCITIPLTSPIPVSQFNEPIKAFNGQQISCNEYGDYVFSANENINGWFMAELVYESDGNATYSQDSGIQVICDGIVVTTMNPLYKKMANGKKFMYSTQLGVFKGGSESGSRRIFGAISNYTSFGNDKIHFLVKEMSNS